MKIIVSILTFDIKTMFIIAVLNSLHLFKRLLLICKHNVFQKTWNIYVDTLSKKLQRCFVIWGSRHRSIVPFHIWWHLNVFQAKGIMLYITPFLFELKTIVYLDVFSFYLVSVSIPRSHLEYYICIYLSCFLRFILTITVSQNFLVFDDVDSFEE